jgi:hypothetical protein
MGLFSKKRSENLKKPKFDAGYGTVICFQPEYYMHASNMMEAIILGVVMHTKKAIGASIKDVKLFNVYDHAAGKFVGSMYAVKVDEMYFGTFVGSKDVILCTDDSFRFAEDDKLYVPIPTADDEAHFLVCNYVKDDGDVEPVALIKKVNEKEFTLLSFTKNASLSDAIDRCVKLVGC